MSNTTDNSGKLFFQKRRHQYDKECAYHTYCNYIQRTYPIIEFCKMNNRTLHKFYEFLWKQGHPFLFIDKSVFHTFMTPVSSLPSGGINKSKVYPTNYFICKDHHIYVVIYRNIRYVVLNSNMETMRFISGPQLYTELNDADYVFIELNDKVVDIINQTMGDIYTKNEYYRIHCDAINDVIEMYKRMTKK
jgi:hypothetical protein